MDITFYKYQGTGNDFVIIDNRQLLIDKNDTKRIAELCDRRFGIGADGLILLENDHSADFKMVYFNADGNEGSMCGNGGRCITAFAKYLSIVKNEADFVAIDGLHKARIDNGIVSLQMQDVSEVSSFDTHLFIDTGSPHHIQLVDELEAYDVNTNGSQLRYSNLYGEAGANINFVEPLSEQRFAVRTYERGVENETLSCGTGVTAVALAMHNSKLSTSKSLDLVTKGGVLNVSFEATESGYQDIWLTGPAILVFTGRITW